MATIVLQLLPFIAIHIITFLRELKFLFPINNLSILPLQQGDFDQIKTDYVHFLQNNFLRGKSIWQQILQNENKANILPQL